VSAQYLTVTGTPPTTTPGTTFGTVTNTGGDNLRCRMVPINGAVIMSLTPGSRVEVREPVASGWYPVRCGSQNGFVSAQYLTVSGTPPTATATATTTPVTPTATTTPDPVTGFGTVTNTGGAALRCRVAPVSGEILTTFAPGARVELRGPVSSGWYPVRCAGQDGWVSAQYLTVTGTPPTTTPGTTFGTVTNTGGDNLRCRMAPINGAVIMSLTPGSRVEVRGSVSSGWYPVRCSGQNGFVSAEYLTVDGASEPDPDPTIGYIDTAGAARANCRTQPSLSGTVITTLAFGSEVTIRGNASAGWTPVRCGTQDGWISSQLISSQPPSAFGPVAGMDRVVRAANVTRTRHRSRAAALVTNNAVRPGKHRPTLR
nr:SH3 domain-containing protein [Chloroflexia bacterium]